MNSVIEQSASSRPRPMTTRWSAVSAISRHQVAGDEHGAALGGQLPGEGADPADALRVQAVDRLVEHDDRRVAEQRGGDAEPLAHAEGEAGRPAGRPPRPARPARAPRRPARPGMRVADREPAQVVAGGAARVQGARLEQRADLAQRRGRVGVAAAVDGHRAGGRPVEAEDHPHRRGLAGAVRAEEAGHPAGLDGERRCRPRRSSSP